MGERVFITGVGITTTLGEGMSQNWSRLISSSSPQIVSKPNADRGLYRAKQLDEQAVAEALAGANLPSSIDPERIGCTVSASKPLFDGDLPQPPEKLNEFVRNRFGIQGECRNVIAACATGVYSVAMAASWIESGLCDVVLAGAVEPYPHPLIAAGFVQMGVTSSEGVTRPFDRNRSGFTFGEGAGIIILESESYAVRHKTKPLARLSGWALGADSHSAFAFNSQGGKISAVIERALEKAGLSPRDIRHVNAHGTATRHNDWIETQALLKTFGSHAKDLMISATKASTGHLLGASGAVELIFAIQALKAQFIPPTATLREPDKDCPLDYTPRQGHAASFEHALSLSFGFGGPIGAITVSRA
jgi:3-oxoacyl-(acyl-carrier-protein) synthase